MAVASLLVGALSTAPPQVSFTLTVQTTDVARLLEALHDTTVLCWLQAQAAAATTAAEEHNQAANTAASPQEGGSPLEQHQQAGAHNGQLEGLPSSADGLVAGQAPELDGHTERQPSLAERQPSGAERYAEGHLQGNGLADQQGSRSEDSELKAARGVWQVFQDLLPVQRYWWEKLHFR